MTTELTPQEMLEWVKQTLLEGSSLQLHLPDDHLAELLFTDFDTGTTSFLHDDNLDLLRTNGLLSEALYDRCRVIREQAMAAINSAVRPVTGQYVRSASEWQAIRRLCDEALALCR